MCQQLCTAAVPAAGSRRRIPLRLNSTWVSAGIGVVILIVSMAMMAYSAPGHAAVASRPAAAHGSVQLPPRLGPVPRGSELRPSR